MNQIFRREGTTIFGNMKTGLNNFSTPIVQVRFLSYLCII